MIKPAQLDLFADPSTPAPTADAAAEGLVQNTEPWPKGRRFLPLDHPDRPRNRNKDKRQ
jgi:hypothetical protein